MVSSTQKSKSSSAYNLKWGENCLRKNSQIKSASAISPSAHCKSLNKYMGLIE